MDAFIITGNRRASAGFTPSVGVYIANVEPDCRTIKGMGFQNFRVEKVAMGKSAPQEPTLYLWARSPAVKEVTVITILGGTLSGASVLKGHPADILPELKGPAVDRLIARRNSPSAADLKKPFTQPLKPARHGKQENVGNLKHRVG